MGEPRFLLLAVADGGRLDVGWRLLGPNNRELGRAAATSRGLTACQASIEQLLEVADVAVPRLDRDPRGLGWRWFLEVDDAPLARSGRFFHRERECRYSLEQFHHALPSAVVRLPASLAALPVVSARAFGGVSPDALTNEGMTA